MMKRSVCVGVCLAATIFVGAASAEQSSKLGVVPGGPHPFFAGWELGAADAVKDFDLGAADYRVPESWTVTKQNEIVESMIVKGYNGFLLFPADPVGSINLYQDIADAGLPVIATAGCIPDPSPVAFCLGTDTGKAAYIGTVELMKSLEGTQKRILHLTSNLVDPNTQWRIDAVERAAKEAGGTVVEVIADMENPQLADDKIKSFLAARSGDIDGIRASSWIAAATTAVAFRNNNERRIKLVGEDHDPATLAAIRDGFMVGANIQNAYGQAYVGSYAIDLLRSGCTVRADAPFLTNTLTAKFIDSGSVFVNAQTVDSYPDLMRQMATTLAATFKEKYFTCG